MPVFGPGTLTIGSGESELDISCQVNSLRIKPSKDAGDSKTMMCGTVKPGKITYTYTLTGSLDVDSNDPEGFFALCAEHPGTQQPFTFVPSEGGTEASGTLIIDPLSFGADEFGDEMDSDIEFDLVGKPLYTYPAGPIEGFISPFAPIIVNGAGNTPQPAGAPPSATGADQAPDLPAEASDDLPAEDLGEVVDLEADQPVDADDVDEGQALEVADQVLAGEDLEERG